MRVLISGASGFVGGALARTLVAEGAQVGRLVRGEPQVPLDVRWSPQAGHLDRAALEAVTPVDAVVHLAGESIAGGRWTAARKARIRDSRRDGTRLLAEALAALAQKPPVFVSASAIGYYGYQGDTELTEDSPAGTGFLPDVCQQWEAAAEPARQAGIRVVHPRIGIVLSGTGGALPTMALPVRMGVGGPLGTGNQWLSWISIDDMLRVLRFAIERNDLEGACNAVSPHPVRNREFTRLLGRVLRRPAFMPVPEFLLKLVLGEMAEILLGSQRVLPARLLQLGFQFRDTDLEALLRRLLVPAT